MKTILSKFVLLLLCLIFSNTVNAQISVSGLLGKGEKAVGNMLDKKAERKQIRQELESHLTIQSGKLPENLSKENIEKAEEIYARLVKSGYKKAKDYAPQISELQKKRRKGLAIIAERERLAKEKEKQDARIVYDRLIANILNVKIFSCSSKFEKKSQIQELQKKYNFPDKESLSLVYGRCYYATRDYKNAIKHINRAKGYFPKLERCQKLYDSYLNLRQYTNALAYTDSLILMFPDSLELKKNRYDICFELDRENEAVELLEYFLKETKGTDKQGFYEAVAGAYYHNKGDYKTSYQHFKNGIAHGDKRDGTYLGAGLGAYHLGDKITAKKYLKICYNMNQDATACKYLQEMSYGITGYDPCILCRDGSISHSQTRQGTCSGHKGVANWNHQEPIYGYKFQCN